MTLSSEVSKSFNDIAIYYDNHAKVQQEIGARLFSRLDYIKSSPRFILDLGCGTGGFSKLLKKKYPAATIIAIDLAHNMLLRAQKKQRFYRHWSLINGDILQLPIADNAIGLIFANQVIHWVKSLPALFTELLRVMQPNGCLLFSTLGPETFKEIRQTWGTIDNYSHTNNFMDMHDLGDQLMTNAFLDPVVDMEMLTAHYQSPSNLLISLKKQGVRNINKNRNPGLTSKSKLDAFYHAYDSLRTVSGKYPLTYEIIYGHAYKNSNEIFIPIAAVKKTTRDLSSIF